MGRLHDKRLQASYTIEAAILMPVFLFAIMQGLLFGIDFYEEVRASAESREWLDEICPTEWIWKRELIEKGVDFIHEYTVSEKFEEQLYGGGRVGAAAQYGRTAGGENDGAAADCRTFEMGDNGTRGRYDFLVSDHGFAEPGGLAASSSIEFYTVWAPAGRAFGIAGGASAILSKM